MYAPSSVPKLIAWPHYLLCIFLELWFCWWTIYATAREFNLAVGILHGLDQIMFSLLWVTLPYTIANSSETVVNTVEFVLSNARSSLRMLNIAYAISFVVLLIPQGLYVGYVGVPFMKEHVCPQLPWATSQGAPTADLIVLSVGMVLNLLAINSTLLYLAMTAHMQSFLVKDFLHRHLVHTRSVRDIRYLKNVLHLTTQSLRQGNMAVESINTILVLGFMLEIIEVVTKMLTESTWTTTNLLPLAIILLQVYFFLIPPAYITSCWDRVFSELLSLHALALSKEEELTSIIMYMKESYRGYTITNIKIDSTPLSSAYPILYFVSLFRFALYPSFLFLLPLLFLFFNPLSTLFLPLLLFLLPLLFHPKVSFSLSRLLTDPPEDVVVYFTYLMIAILAIKSQRDVHFWLPN
eukprot:TRINITY_DN9335_c0_g1_i1.p1 TRINITY_DN9335_c0_g1~~TRINITY_DN9335_c0_g1_i1.p1  ORF type:complete len:408 (-),score=52.49 TRINITY_DN9335_c0_g1_i1:70-1293(-)